MRITLDSNPVGAPGGCYLIVADDGRERFIQTDWDYPGVASSFGWSISSVFDKHVIPCDHSHTDGTVACPDCGLTPSDFISAAREWLDENDGATADDPGYFE